MPIALLVDADPIQGEVAAQVCHGLGYRAVFAATLAGAMTIAAREHLAFVIVDKRLPDASGSDAAARLAAIGRPGLPIVIAEKPYRGWSLREQIRALAIS